MQNSALVGTPRATFSYEYADSSHSIGRVLQRALPKTWFCFISRGVIQAQSILKPHKWPYWSKITDQIYLGAMPLKNLNHINKISNLGIKTVLSMNEYYEFQKQIFDEPVKSNDWKEKNINFFNVASPDLEPVGLSKLIRAINYVVQQVNLGNSIYIHCNAGRGRSATVAICSLIQIKGYTVEESINYVKTCRPQVMLNQKQIETIVSWYQHMQKNHFTNAL